MNFCFSRGRSLTCSNLRCICDCGPGLEREALGWLPRSSATERSRAEAARSMKSRAGFGDRAQWLH